MATVSPLVFQLMWALAWLLALLRALGQLLRGWSMCGSKTWSWLRAQRKAAAQDWHPAWTMAWFSYLLRRIRWKSTVKNGFRVIVINPVEPKTTEMKEHVPGSTGLDNTRPCPRHPYWMLCFEVNSVYRGSAQSLLGLRRGSWSSSPLWSLGFSGHPSTSR